MIDQSLFSSDYRGIETWEASLRATLIEPLGLSAVNAVGFVVGHVIYSFCAPIAVAEAWRPATARTPWLGLRGTAVAAVLYLPAAVVVLQDPESHSARRLSLPDRWRLPGCASVPRSGGGADLMAIGRRVARPGCG